MSCRYRYGILWLLLLSLTITTQAQKDIWRKMDSLSRLPPPLKRDNKDSIRREFYNQKTRITFPVYFKLLGHDLKQQVTSAVQPRARLWNRTAAVVAATGGVLLLDVPISKNAVDWRKKSTTLVSTSKYITRFGGMYEVYTLAALGTYGWVFKNEKIKTTTLLATQAYITSAVIFEAGPFLQGW